MYFHISRRFWNFQSLCTAWCKHHWNTHISLTCSDLHITAPQLPDVRGKLFTLSSHLQFSFISKSVRFPFKQLCRWTISNKDRSLSQISKSPGLHFFSNQIFSYWKQRYKLCNQTAGTRNGTKMSCAALSASCRISASDVQASKADQEFLHCYCRLNGAVNRRMAPTTPDSVSNKLLPVYILRCTETKKTVKYFMRRLLKTVAQMLGDIFQFSRSGRRWEFRYTHTEQHLAIFYLCRLLDSSCVTVLGTKPAQINGEPQAFLQPTS